MYYRYELEIDGEGQDVGIVQGLDDTGLSDCVKDALVAGLDGRLPLPPVFSNGRTASYFTERGLAEFGADMECIARAYEDDGLFDVVMVEVEGFPEDAIAYEDEWQVVVWL